MLITRVSLSHSRSASSVQWQLHGDSCSSGPYCPWRDAPMLRSPARNLSGWRFIGQARQHHYIFLPSFVSHGLFCHKAAFVLTSIHSYVDLYASTEAGLGAFLGNRSINVHTSNATRLTCANFTLTSGSGSNTTVTSPTGGATPPQPFTGGAAASFIGTGAVIAGLLAFLL